MIAIVTNLDFEISVEYELDKFRAHSPQVGYHENHHIQFRNCMNVWLLQETNQKFLQFLIKKCWEFSHCQRHPLGNNISF